MIGSAILARMERIALSDQERASQQLTPAHLAAACEAIRRDGVVVLEQAVPAGVLERLRTRMDEDTEALLAFQAARGGNPRAEGHLQQGPPPFAPYVSQDVTANPFAIAVSKHMLGEGAYLAFYNGNTNLPGSVYQAVHLDQPHLWSPAQGHAAPPYSLIVNISPMDCHAGNGAVELWPGSHRVMDAYEGNHVPPHLLDARRRHSPPVRCVTRAGDVAIRDSRLWHRGVPNLSSEARHMVASIHAAPWYQRRRQLEFGEDCRSLLDAVDFDFNAVFTSDPIDYLFGPTREIYDRTGIWREDRAAAAREAANSGRLPGK